MKEFLVALKRAQITSQQRKTLRGQALAGDLEGAKRGLQRLLSIKESKMKEAK